jgi:cellulose synthase/poly-beta-1,6-N-acetylglucosamine synthase-like glycosyltransferase
MIVLSWIIIFYFTLFFLLIFSLIFFISYNKKDIPSKEIRHPFVSILVAARNEEENIITCLTALNALTYPKDKWEVLVGNDHSEDKTAELVKKFTEGRSNFKMIDIKENMGLARGKANVLAHLTKEAGGEFFFITDADIEVKPGWIEAMLSYHEPKIGIVSGLAIINGDQLLDKFQSLDWIFAFGMVKVSSDLHMPVSAVGHNMMISRAAYESTGGYEKIPFSVTEDLELFKHTLKKGWGYKNLADPEVLAFTRPIKGFWKLILQRKRWMNGAMEIPFYLIAILTLQALFFPLIILTIVLFPVAGLLLWTAKIFFQNSFNYVLLERLKQKKTILIYCIPYELYCGLLSTIMLIYYWIPDKVVWKGRRF